MAKLGVSYGLALLRFSSYGLALLQSSSRISRERIRFFLWFPYSSPIFSLVSPCDILYAAEKTLQGVAVMRNTCRGKCLKCGRPFVADRYNKHHQKYCTHPKCVAERTRERKSRYYSRRRQENPAFCEKERKRCKEAMARTRAHKRQAGASSVPTLPEPAVNHVVAGLIAQLNNCTEPQLLREQVSNYAEQGRLLSAQFPFF
jgi:hypothetical protein